MSILSRFCVPTIALVCSPAFAEVCDKERPGWHGAPVSATDEALYLFASPIVWIAVLMCAIGIATGLRGFPMLGLIIIIATSAVKIADWTSDFAITQAAIREGCVGSPYLGLALLISAPVISIWLAQRKAA